MRSPRRTASGVGPPHVVGDARVDAPLDALEARSSVEMSPPSAGSLAAGVFSVIARRSSEPKKQHARGGRLGDVVLQHHLVVVVDGRGRHAGAGLPQHRPEPRVDVGATPGDATRVLLAIGPSAMKRPSMRSTCARPWILSFAGERMPTSTMPPMTRPYSGPKLPGVEVDLLEHLGRDDRR